MIARLFPSGLGAVGSVGSHWSEMLVTVTNRLVISATWEVRNPGNKDAKAYMELEVVRPQWPSPQRLVATLPGENSFTSEMNRKKVLYTLSPVYDIMAGLTETVTGQVQLAADGVPNNVKLDLRVRVRRVDNPAESDDPTKVGPIITNGEHKQDSVIMVTRELPLEALGYPDMASYG